MIYAGLSCITRLWKSAGYHRWISAILIAVSFVSFCNLVFAAEKLPRYKVIPGSDDKAYLLDTSTGSVWILTHRTLAAEREAVAIPYKFIKISPKNQKAFMVEDAPNIPMPVNRIPQ